MKTPAEIFDEELTKALGMSIDEWLASKPAEQREDYEHLLKMARDLGRAAIINKDGSVTFVPPSE